MRQAQQTTAQGAGKARRGVGENLPRARQINHHWVGRVNGRQQIQIQLQFSWAQS